MIPLALRPLVLVLALAAPAVAQGYFPLGDGDRWEYGYILHPPGADADTTRFAPVGVVGHATVDGVDYAVVDFVLVPDTVRVDDLGRVWAREGGRDRLFLDVTRADGETYTYGEGENEATVTVRRPQRVTVPAGTFDGAIEFSFDTPFVNDDERSITLARGVGMLSAFGAWQVAVLFAADIDGARVTAAEPALGPLAAWAFPTPFRHRVAVELPPGPWSQVVVVDALGRRVAVLDVPACTAVCAVAWDGGDAPAGWYLVWARGPRGDVAVPVVRGR